MKAKGKKVKVEKLANGGKKMKIKFEKICEFLQKGNIVRKNGVLTLV